MNEIKIGTRSEHISHRMFSIHVEAFDDVVAERCLCTLREQQFQQNIL